MKSKTLLLIVNLAFAGAAFASEPTESGATRVCGTLKSFEGVVQIFDHTRTHLGDAAFGAKLSCGDWISIEKGRAVLEHFSGAAVSVGQSSFIQILDPQSGENADHAQFTLYRGEMAVSSPKKTVTLVATPNAFVRIASGTGFVLYSTSAKQSQAIGLGGTVTIENRFLPGQRTQASYAQMVSFSDPTERLVPEEARFANSQDLNSRLARLGIPAAVREAVDRAVKMGVRTRMPTTLASERTAPKIQGVPAGEFSVPFEPAHAARSPASVAAKPAAKRKPAQAKVAAKKADDEPDFSLGRKSDEESEKKRLVQALSSMRVDEE
jgi:hypothetical protein